MKKFIKENGIAVFILFWVLYAFIFFQTGKIQDDSVARTPEEILQREEFQDCVDNGKGGWQC